LNFSVSVDIDCNCSDSLYSIVGTLYTCFVQKDLNIDSYENALVSSVTGSHKSGKTNDDVIGFQNNDKKFYFFPRNLENHLKNLKAIWLSNANIKEISQTDLKPYPQLEFFGLPSNKIEVLEEGLFDYNTKLKGVWLESNSINYIDATIFDKLTNLITLVLNSNVCIKSESRDSSSKVQELVTSVKASCQDSSYLAINNKLKNLEDASNNLDPKSLTTFNQNLNSFDDEFKKSKFSYLTSMKLRLKSLNDTYSKLENNSRSINEINNCYDCCEKISLTNLTQQIIELQKNVQISANETLNAINSVKGSHNEKILTLDESLFKLDKKVSTLDDKFIEFDEKVSNLMAHEPNKDEQSSNFDDRVLNFEESLNEFQTKAIQKFGNIEAEIIDSRFKILKSVDLSHQQLEKRMVEKIDAVEKMLNERLVKIMKALNVEE